jgi:hypothetical protein
MQDLAGMVKKEGSAGGIGSIEELSSCWTKGFIPPPCLQYKDEVGDKWLCKDGHRNSSADGF